MNRDEAERALSVIRKVIQNTREDLVAHNWGLIWMVHAFTNLSACLAGWYIAEHDPTCPVYWYLVPFAIVGALDLVIVQLLRSRDQGVRSYVEWQLHGIWTSFVIFTAAGALALQLNDAPPRQFASLFALTTGFSFAMMGVVFSRQWIFAILFLIIAALGPVLPGGAAVGPDRGGLVGGDVPARPVHASGEATARTRWNLQRNPLSRPTS